MYIVVEKVLVRSKTPLTMCIVEKALRIIVFLIFLILLCWLKVFSCIRAVVTSNLVEACFIGLIPISKIAIG